MTVFPVVLELGQRPRKPRIDVLNAVDLHRPVVLVDAVGNVRGALDPANSL